MIPSLLSNSNATYIYSRVKILILSDTERICNDMVIQFLFPRISVKHLFTKFRTHVILCGNLRLWNECQTAEQRDCLRCDLCWLTFCVVIYCCVKGIQIATKPDFSTNVSVNWVHKVKVTTSGNRECWWGTS